MRDPVKEPRWYLWDGDGAVEMLDKVQTDLQALDALLAKKTGDWTLWKKEKGKAQLLAAVAGESRQLARFVTIGK